MSPSSKLTPQGTSATLLIAIHFAASLTFVCSQTISECQYNQTVQVLNGLILDYAGNYSTSFSQCLWQLNITQNALVSFALIISKTQFTNTTPAGSLLVYGTVGNQTYKSLYLHCDEYSLRWPPSDTVSSSLPINLTSVSVSFPLNNKTVASRFQIQFTVVNVPPPANNITVNVTMIAAARIGYDDVPSGQSRIYEFGTLYVQIVPVIGASGISSYDSYFRFITSSGESLSLAELDDESPPFAGSRVTVLNENSEEGTSSNGFYMIGVNSKVSRFSKNSHAGNTPTPVLARPGNRSIVNNQVTLVGARKQLGIVFSEVVGTVGLFAGRGNTSLLMNLNSNGSYQKSWLIGDVFTLDASNGGRANVITTDDTQDSLTVTVPKGTRGFIMSAGNTNTSQSGQSEGPYVTFTHYSAPNSEAVTDGFFLAYYDASNEDTSSTTRLVTTTTDRQLQASTTVTSVVDSPRTLHVSISLLAVMTEFLLLVAQ